jgi:hypothetical protein
LNSSLTLPTVAFEGLRSRAFRDASDMLQECINGLLIHDGDQEHGKRPGDGGDKLQNVHCIV